MVNPTATAQRAQEVRDLKTQVAELAGESDQEIVFKETSPRKKMVPIFSMVDGEPLSIPEAQMERILGKPLPGGGFMFTSHQEEAPPYIRGKVKCFLHEESPEREMLKQIGLGGKRCPAAGLASGFSKRIHAQHRHHQEWEALQEYLREGREETQRDQQKQQTDAMIRLADNAQASEPVFTLGTATASADTPEEQAADPMVSCDHEDCAYEGSRSQVQGHQSAHK